jgi:ribosomal-protein-alanine N-acetyltransferase
VPAVTATLIGRRVLLRPLAVEDYPAWREVRSRNADWLLKWEPMRTPGAPDPVGSQDAFAVRCGARQRERQLGTGYGYGIFVDGHFAGEINLSIVQRGPFQSCYVGYWIDEARAGKGYMPEAVVLLCRAAFEDLRLHRVQVSIIPRNSASRRVVEKLGIRDEGIAQRYLEINGVWEDHMRFAITSEEWERRRDDLVGNWAY